MRRVLRAGLGILIACIALPPLWFAIAPEPVPALPPPGRRVSLPDGTGINVVGSGVGKPVLLVHGLPGCAYDWRLTAAALQRRGLRALAYDRVGWGHSDPRTKGAYTPGSNADELLALLEALDVRDAIVVGWSYGGATAMTAAQRDDSRIARLVLVGTGGPDSDDAEPPSPPLAMRLINSSPAIRWRRAVPPVARGFIQAVSAAAYSDGPVPEWWVPGIEANLARWETFVAYRNEMAGLTAESVADFDPTRIRVPTLLVHGDDDRLAPVAVSRYLTAKIPRARLLELPGASHMLPVTHPDMLAGELAALAATN